MIDIPDSIFPVDAAGNPVCPKCRALIKDCGCPSVSPVKPKPLAFTPVVGLDKSGRKGKIVTLISGLPKDESYLKDLSKILKAKTGSGGTFYVAEGAGVIELQGDHREKVLQQMKELTN